MGSLFQICHFTSSVTALLRLGELLAAAQNLQLPKEEGCDGAVYP